MNFDDIAIRSLLIVLVGLGVGAVLSKRTAATRHLVYAGLLLSIVLLPVLRQWGPTRSVPLETLPAPVRELAARIDSNPVVATADAAVQSGPALAADSHWPARLLISVWMLGSLLLIGRLFTGIALTAKLVRSGERLYLFGSEQYEIRVVKGVNVPATTWIGRQVILLPTNYESWPPERVRSVVLHEAAHIARRDWFVQFFGRVACALYWPNPLVWLANRRMVDLAEQAADDLVL
ncbi:MAG TPA: M56 family metallopeptidase, partial [Fimbriimonadaceae bacterium]|nr:M56 family metallopeptidase [Fimbriimonadaceae bacterium]